MNRRRKIDWRILLILGLLIAGLAVTGRLGEKMQPRPSCGCGGSHSEGSSSCPLP